MKALIIAALLGVNSPTEKLAPPPPQPAAMLCPSYSHFCVLITYYMREDMIIAEVDIDNKTFIGWGIGNKDFIGAEYGLLENLSSEYPDAVTLTTEEVIKAYGFGKPTGPSRRNPFDF